MFSSPDINGSSELDCPLHSFEYVQTARSLDEACSPSKDRCISTNTREINFDEPCLIRGAENKNRSLSQAPEHIWDVFFTCDHQQFDNEALSSSDSLLESDRIEKSLTSPTFEDCLDLMITDGDENKTKPGGSSSGTSYSTNSARICKSETRQIKRREFHKVHTRRSRAKLNERMKVLKNILPVPPEGVTIKSKAQIIEYTISILQLLLQAEGNDIDTYKELKKSSA